MRRTKRCAGFCAGLLFTKHPHRLLHLLAGGMGLSLEHAEQSPAANLLHNPERHAASDHR